MLAAMDQVGNPSSVHAEGRSAKAIVERARAQVAALVGCEAAQVVFTGSATEAAALAVAQKGRHGGRFAALPTEHDCLGDWSEEALPTVYDREGRGGQIGSPEDLAFSAWISKARNSLRDLDFSKGCPSLGLLALSAANSETGLLAERPRSVGEGRLPQPVYEGLEASTAVIDLVVDVTQLCGKMRISIPSLPPSYAILSAHKFGGPKGVGALISFSAEDPQAILKGGGQEMGRRSGTENVIGIAGFGAAAEAAKRDVDAGHWAQVEKLRNILEKALADISKETIFVGKAAPRLPNTTCFITPGWKGETQVMQMDLAGFAISAGSACSSGKVKPSRVLKAMGYSDLEAASAVRVSMGLETTEEEIMRFIEAWGRAYEKWRARAA